MNETQARAQLTRMIALDRDPVLDAADLDQLVALAKRPDAAGQLPLASVDRDTPYQVGDRATPATGNGHRYEVTTAGTSGAVAPVFATGSGSTTADGSVVWTEVGLDTWSPTWDLNFAAAEGWRWKAGNVAGEFDVAIGDGMNFRRSQAYAACMRQAAIFASRSMQSVQSVSVAPPNPYSLTLTP